MKGKYGGDTMIKIQSEMSVYDLVTTYPEIQEIMIGLGFKDIVKPGMLLTAGRVMTLKKGAALKKIDWETMKNAFEKNGFELE